MENEYLNQNQLTSEGDSPKLNEGVVYRMSDVTHVEGAAPGAPEPPKTTEAKPSEEGADKAAAKPPEATAGSAGGGGGSEKPSTSSETPAGGDDDEEEGGSGSRHAKTMEYYRKKYNEDPLHEAFMRELRDVNPHVDRLEYTDLVKFLTRLRDDTEGVDDDKPLMYLVNRLVANALDNETSQYSLGLTAQSNLDAIFSELKEALSTAAPEFRVRIKARTEKVLTTYEAVRLLHNMNRAIVTSGTREFQQLANDITPEQQQILQEVPGAAQVMRFFDQEYQRILMDEKTVTTEKNDEILGRSVASKKEGDRAREVGIVEKRLLDLIQYAKAAEDIPEDSPLGQLKKLSDWEIPWAFNAGRLLYNLSLRAAEQISLSEVPKGDAAWRSPPQEYMVRTFNQLQWIMQRFEKGKARGGVDYLRKVQDHYLGLRERQGYGTTGLTKIAGKNVEDYEISGMFKVSGIFSSWRNRAIILDHSPITISGEKTYIGKYVKAAREKAEAKYGDRIKKDESFKKIKEPEILREIYLTGGELRPEFTNALGVLLGFEDVNPKEKDVQIPGLVEVKAQIREAIWKRIAVDNPLAVAYLLRGMEFSKTPHFHHGGEAEFTKFTKRLDTKSDDKLWGGYDVGEGSEAKHVKGLREKLIMAGELRMSRIAKGEHISLENVLETMKGEYVLNNEEKEFLKELQAYGQDVSKDLATVRLPFNPFMNDVVFEASEYRDAGSVYYTRRVGDIGSISQSYEELTKVVADTAGISREDALKALKEAIAILDGPNSWGTAQEEVLPFFMALIDFWEAGGTSENPLLRWARKDNLFGPLAHYLRVPNSVAQKYGGTDAIAYDEFAMWGVLNEAYAMGITRKAVKGADGLVDITDSDDFLRKKKKLKFGGVMLGLLLAALRDITKVFFVAAFYEGFKQAKKQEK